MSRPLVFRLALLGVALVCALTVPNGFAVGAVDALSKEVRTVFSRCQGAVVKIEATDRDGLLRGTGFFIDPDGTLITSFSVGGESRDICVVSGTDKSPMRRLIADPRSGIAILKLEKVTTPTAYLPFAKVADLGVATAVLSIAYPLDLPVTPNFGFVAGFNSKYQDRYFAVTHIRANVPVHRGEGGAPLINLRGEVVGVVISGLEGGASCFALPIKAATKVHQDYVRFGETHPGRLGVVLREAIKAVQGSTAVVLRLEEDAPALKAGIQKGDVILKIGQNAIQAPEDVQNASFYLTAGERVPVKVARSGEVMTIEVEPTERSGMEYRLRTLHASAPAPSSLVDITLRRP